MKTLDLQATPMAGIELPSGRTTVSRSELRDLVDIDACIQHLAQHGVREPVSRLDEFLAGVPVLLKWLETHGRVYPWRETTDPWHVYISEILLQRTRADSVEQIYHKFFNRFPGPESLYRTDESEIRVVVSPLGFGNQRTRTLTEVAKLVYCEHDGSVPDDAEELMRPWRVGPYSARACLQFAFGQPHPLVDMNTARIIERALGYEMPNQPHKSQSVHSLMGALVPDDPAVSRAFNLALLDLGAAICTSQSPACSECPLEQHCFFATTA